MRMPMRNYKGQADRGRQAAVDNADLIEQRLTITCRRHPEFPREIVLLIRMIRQIARHTAAQANAILRTWGISYVEYLILMSLYGTEACSLSAAVLRDLTGEKPVNIIRLAEALCAKGLITRAIHTQDKRRAVFSLTAKGTALIDTFLPVLSALLDRWPQVLEPAEFEQLERLLRKILHECEG